MSERREKKRRIEQRLRLVAWLEEEPAWWRFAARKRWRARRPKKPKNFRMNYRGYTYVG